MLCMSCNRRGRWYKSSFKPSVSHMLFGQFLSQNMTEVISFFTMKVMCGCVTSSHGTDYDPQNPSFTILESTHFSLCNELANFMHRQSENKWSLYLPSRKYLQCWLWLSFQCSLISLTVPGNQRLVSGNLSSVLWMLHCNPTLYAFTLRKQWQKKIKKLPYWSSASCEVLKSSQRCFLGIVSGTLCY